MSQDTRYLERKDGKWRVSIAVPRRLQRKLGTRLKRSLQTDSLVIANQLKWPVIAELKAELDSEGGRSNELLREALEVARLRGRATSEELEDINYAVWLKAEEIQGRPLGETEDLRTGERTPIYDPSREKAALSYADVAHGKATPIDAHHPDYFKQISANLTRRTAADDQRAIRFLQTWCDREKVPFLLHAITRRTARQFMEELATVSGAPSPVTHRKYLTRLSRYWRWMLEREIVSANPWADLKSDIKPTPFNERERAFTDAEVRKLLEGPATPAMQDLMRIAALSGARLDTIVDLRARDCEGGVFVFKPQKKEQGPRRVPAHSAIVELVAKRCENKEPDDPLFPEWPAPANPKSQRERSFKASNAFTAYRRKVGVDEVIGGKRRSLVNFHSFRRWFITKAEQAGILESLIASVVGHKRPGMTLGRYSAGPKVEQLRACIEAVKLP